MDDNNDPFEEMLNPTGNNVPPQIAAMRRILGDLGFDTKAMMVAAEGDLPEEAVELNPDSMREFIAGLDKETKIKALADMLAPDMEGDPLERLEQLAEYMRQAEVPEYDPTKEWELFEVFLSKAADHLEPFIANGDKDAITHMRVVSSQVWTTNMIVLQIMSFDGRDGEVEIDDEYISHVLQHVVDALFGMAGYVVAYRLDKDRLKEQLMEHADRRMTEKCAHQELQHTSMLYAVGRLDAAPVDDAIEMMAEDISAMASVMRHHLSGAEDEDKDWSTDEWLNEVWERIAERDYSV